MNNKKDKFLSKEESEKCCKPAEDGGPDKPQNCVDQWRIELKNSTQEYNEAAALAAGIEKVYSNLVAWDEKLKAWIKNAENADKTLSDMQSELQQFLILADTLKENTRKTGHAVQILCCLIKYIFDHVCELLQNNTNSSDPQDLIQQLKDYIDCLPSLDEQKKMEALKCVTAYEDKVKAVYELQDALLNKLLAILLAAKYLAKGIGNNKGNFGWGLYKQLEDLKNRIQGQNADTKAKKCIQNAPPAAVDVTLLPPCGVSIYKPKSKLLPVSSSMYYKDLKELEKIASGQIAQQKSELDKIRQVRDNYLTRKNSLADAISAADAAAKAK